VRRLALVALALAACGVRPGDACNDDAACSPDLVCMKPAGASSGICSFAPLTPGFRCLSSADCAAGLFCTNDLSVGEKEFSGSCQPAQGAGSPCFRNGNCASPLKCIGVDSGALGICG